MFEVILSSMNRTVKKIGIILAIIILLPALFFIVYEINSLNENEEVLETIYTSQLDAILFTVNQYSEDVIRSYAAKINFIPSTELNSAQLRTVLRESESLIYAAAVDSADNITDVLLDSTYRNNFRQEFTSLLKTEKDLINRLRTYFEEGFQKFEPVIHNGNIHLFFLSRRGVDNYIFDFVLQPESFINKVLAPKIQQVAGEQFIIKISEGDNVLYSSAEDESPVKVNRDIWLAPGYSLGILLQGTTIEELVKERFTTNIIIISILSLILIIGVVIVFRNIKQEIEFAQVKSDFVSNVSHELRTPLALISMFAETLDMGRVRTEEKKKEYLRIISQETNRLSRIVNKILNFSRMEAGKRKYNFTAADINEIVSGVYETYKFHLQNNGFSFSYYPSEDLPQVEIDPEAASEALINLIDNAMKYSEETKDVSIHTGTDNGYIFIEVRDKGIGISDENQKKIFDKFFRVTSGLVHNTKGTGLGLTLVKHIMDAHKGDIEVKSKLWEGSSFKLKFPANKK
jgi:two-component system, OmpR family, phosphate regulon sensor histidine kinase PhoR